MLNRVIYWLTREWVNFHMCKPSLDYSYQLIYWCINLDWQSQIYIFKTKEKQYFSFYNKKDSEANGSSNLQIILTWRWLDNFEPEGEACRINPAETCGCACKSTCTLFSHSAVRFLSMWPLTNACNFTNPFNARSALLA